MDPAYFLIGLGLLSMYGGFYMRQHPDGRWNRLAANNREMWRDPQAEQNIHRGAPLVGSLLIVVGIGLILTAAVNLVGGLLGI